jgi:hypothetical protein
MSAWTLIETLLLALLFFASLLVVWRVVHPGSLRRARTDLALSLLTPLAGYWLALRATSPIAEILRTADQLRPTRLGDRLEVRGTKDELDRQYQQRATTLMVPPNLEDSAKSILNAQQAQGSANWGGNPHGDMDLIVWNLLEDTNAWYVLARSDMGSAGRGPRGIVVYDDPAGVETFWVHDLADGDKVKVYANCYMGLYCYDWRAVQSNALATS